MGKFNAGSGNVFLTSGNTRDNELSDHVDDT